MSTTQETVYEKTVKPLINDLLSGINSTILPMVRLGWKDPYYDGDINWCWHDTTCPKELFYEVGVLQEEFKSTGQNETIQIELSYLEVYNEKIYDLLNPGAKNL